MKALKKCSCKVFASLCFLAVLLSGIIGLIGLTYDGSAKWIDWANLIVNIIGTIGLTLFIYWMGSVRAEKERNEKRKVEILNILFSEYIRFAEKLTFTATIVTGINHEMENALLLISKNSLGQKQYKKAISSAFNIPSPLIYFNLSESEVSFIATENRDLFLNIIIFYDKLHSLKENLEKFHKDTCDELENYRVEQIKNGGSPLTHAPLTEDVISMLFTRVRLNTIPVIQMLECCINIMKTLIPDSIEYANELYKNKTIITRTTFEPFEKIMNYKFEKFDPKCERIG